MFKGLGQIGDMAKMMKQAQEMQSKMADAQKMIDQIEGQVSQEVACKRLQLVQKVVFLGGS